MSRENTNSKRKLFLHELYIHIYYKCIFTMHVLLYKKKTVSNFSVTYTYFK